MLQLLESAYINLNWSCEILKLTMKVCAHFNITISYNCRFNHCVLFAFNLWLLLFFAGQKEINKKNNLKKEILVFVDEALFYLFIYF